jgi:poly-gamma-glutamate synthesis protein (capsule biosynthesis protein)
MRTEPKKGAAMFRNRLTTAQHVELWRTFLTSVIEGGRAASPREARRMVEEYFTRGVADKPPRSVTR